MELNVGPYRRTKAHYLLTVSFQCCVFFRGHGGLLDVVPPHLRVLPVRGGEAGHRCGQGDQKDPQAAEEEGEKGNQNPPAGSVTAHRGPHTYSH